jgi:oligopeptide/dipeptide ABC transporter ATP-binding protein
LLSVADLRIRFASREVVGGVGIELAAGRTLGVVGESGSGKTLTALALLGLVPPPGRVSGRVRFDGQDLLGLDEPGWRRVRGGRIAMVFQEPMTALNPTMRIGHQIAEALVLHRDRNWQAAEAEAVRLLDAVGIASPSARALAWPHELSGGMRQRAMIAAALAGAPALLVADEPTTALDVTIQAQIHDLLADLRENTAMAMIFISHNLAVVGEIADEIAVMYAGLIVERAPAEALLSRPRHPYTQGLIATLPDPDRRSARLPTIAGHIGDLPKAGCRFAPRCPHAVDACRLAQPELRQVEEGHFAACILA